jgi:hypothetical protein
MSRGLHFAALYWEQPLALVVDPAGIVCDRVDKPATSRTSRAVGVHKLYLPCVPGRAVAFGVALTPSSYNLPNPQQRY